MSEQKMLLDAFEEIREADATIARLTSELAEARAERDRALPFEAALRARHNSFDPAHRKEFGIECEPTPLEGIDQLVDEAEDLVRRECKILMDEQSAELADLRKRVSDSHSDGLDHLFRVTFNRGDKCHCDTPSSAPCPYNVYAEGIYIADLHGRLVAARREQSATAKGDE